MRGTKLLVSIVVTAGLMSCAGTPPETENTASAIAHRIDNANSYDAAKGNCPGDMASYCVNRSGVLLGPARYDDCTCMPREALRQSLDVLYGNGN